LRAICRHARLSRQLFEFFEEHLAPALQFDFAQITSRIQHAIRKRLLVFQCLDHSMLDCILGDQIDYCHCPCLMFAPRSRNALFEPGWIPRQIAINHHARVLQIQSRRPRICAQKHPATRVRFKRIDFRSPPLLRHTTRMPRKPKLEPIAKLADKFQHPLPFGEHNHLSFLIVFAFLQHLLQFGQFRTRTMFRIEDMVRVANHPHHV
jgi:hypothetical protein